jgi:xylan 1,4-beta-xylosidase
MSPNERTYANPILPGFHPDPSILRVGEDFYLVNSTFQYFPGVCISHSRDLVHWRCIGHALTDPEALDLSGFGNSQGVWAPDISYHDGWFYIFYPLVLRDTDNRVHVWNCSVRSRSPEGPYGPPAVLNREGIDPSHFVDIDGRHYMVFNPGVKILPLDDDCTKAVGEPIELWRGTDRKYPEGPHVFHRDGYYYLLLAEGGTGWNHAMTCARSRALGGPYEPSPYNPLITQTDRAHPIQKTGHGKLVDTPRGEWWAVYLCGRPNEGDFCTLGRETCLDPVEWTEDGWFTINEGRGPSVARRVPDLPSWPVPPQSGDEFEGFSLGARWQFVRRPAYHHLSFDARPGWLRMRAGVRELTDTCPETLILQREISHRYTVETRMSMPCVEGVRAGLTSYYDTTCFVSLALMREGSWRAVGTVCRNGEIEQIGCVEVDEADELYLKQGVDGQRRELLVSSDALSWHGCGCIDDARFLSDEGTREQCFTGTMVGLFCTTDTPAPERFADFDYFRVTLRERT